MDAAWTLSGSRDMTIAPRTTAVLTAFAAGWFPSSTYAHKASTGWTYPPACCKSDEVGGDCQAIPFNDVTRGRKGYEIFLHPGDHFMATRPHHFFVPYGDELPSGDDQFHLCLHPTESDLNCFFAPEGDA
jgi:hypothetical protein